MRRPNIVIVVADQMRGQAMGFLGEENVITPNLDNFSTESLVLDSASATYPICSPFRAMLMTGKYPVSNKVIDNCTNKTAPFGVELQENDCCWSDILKTNDYSLGYIGKWHLDSPREPYIDCSNNNNEVKWNEWCPPNRRHGFDFWYSYGTYDRHNRPLYWSTNAKREEFKYVDQWGPEHETDIAINYLQNTNTEYRDSDKPFGLVVSMNPPHSPYNLVPEEYIKQYDQFSDEELIQKLNIPPAGTKWGDYYREHIRGYLAMITSVDKQFGRIMDALKENNLAKNTIVLFTSDHGNCLGIHNEISKSVCYEESIRIPFMIRWPDKITVKRDNLLISAPDIYPTIVELLGFKDDIPQNIEGTSYAPLFLGEKQSRPTSQLYLRCFANRKDENWRGIRTNTHTYAIKGQSLSEIEETILFDNINDPYQMKNIVDNDSYRIITKQLKKELENWLEKTNDPWKN